MRRIFDYIHAQPGWPELTWDPQAQAGPLAALLKALTSDVVKSSEIEGEKLDERQARCSQDSAQRDITELVERGILERGAAGGRSTSHSLKRP